MLRFTCSDAYMSVYAEFRYPEIGALRLKLAKCRPALAHYVSIFFEVVSRGDNPVLRCGNTAYILDRQTAIQYLF